jgi:hypothetical protein
MLLEILDAELSICKLAGLPERHPEGVFFLSRTDEEVSLVCETGCIPADCVNAETGWRAIRVVGTLGFSLTGILASLLDELSAAGIPVFTISTYNTDYVLVKAAQLRAAIDALTRVGHRFK